MEFGERRGDATDYANLRLVFQSLAKYERAQEYHEKALAMRMEIGERKEKQQFIENLVLLFKKLNDKCHMVAKSQVPFCLMIKFVILELIITP